MNAQTEANVRVIAGCFKRPKQKQKQKQKPTYERYGCA